MIEIPQNDYNKWVFDFMDFIQDKVWLPNEIREELLNEFYDL